MNKKNLILVLTILILVISMYYCGGGAQEKAQEKPAADKAADTKKKEQPKDAIADSGGSSDNADTASDSKDDSSAINRDPVVEKVGGDSNNNTSNSSKSDCPTKVNIKFVSPSKKNQKVPMDYKIKAQLDKEMKNGYYHIFLKNLNVQNSLFTLIDSGKLKGKNINSKIQFGDYEIGDGHNFQILIVVTTKYLKKTDSWIEVGLKSIKSLSICGNGYLTVQRED